MRTAKPQKKQLEDNKLIQVWFKKEVAERIESVAGEKNQSVSEFIRQASILSMQQHLGTNTSAMYIS